MSKYRRRAGIAIRDMVVPVRSATLLISILHALPGGVGSIDKADTNVCLGIHYVSYYAANCGTISTISTTVQDAVWLATHRGIRLHDVVQHTIQTAFGGPGNAY